MKVGIVAQRGNDRAATLADELAATLVREDVAVAFDESTAAALDRTDDALEQAALSTADLVVSIGGDGTFLYAARGAGGTPVVGVNLGEVGFLNAVRPAEAVETVTESVRALGRGDLHVREAPRLAATGDGWAGDPAMNEVVVQGPRRGHGGGVEYEVRVDGATYSSGHADGVLIATPTGSTAYNLSERGPLVHPDVEGLVVTEMSAVEGMPPLVVPGDATVSVRLTDDRGGVVVADGRHIRQLETPAEVAVATTTPPVRLAGPRADFFEALGKLD
jgi:NAD+ kinase